MQRKWEAKGSEKETERKYIEKSKWKNIGSTRKEIGMQKLAFTHMFVNIYVNTIYS